MNILSTAYLGNIQYFTKLLNTDEGPVIDLAENYQKQSYRNRCDILGANGVITLIVPVFKKSGSKTSVKDTLIDYSKPWQRQHWISIVSAYRNSPYFDYYTDDFFSFFMRREKYLKDWNGKLQDTIFEIIGISPSIKYSDTYIVPRNEDNDFRHSISSKPRLRQQDDEFCPHPYYQVFSDKFGFTPNLSILDLLFCEGPESASVIKASVKK